MGDTATQTAEAIFAAVAAGKTVFTRAKTEWMIVGPAAQVRLGVGGADYPIHVTREDGDTVLVWITDVVTTNTTRGIAYSVARFRHDKVDPLDPAPRPRRPRTATPESIPGFATPHTAAGGCYHCGVVGCTDCG